MELSGTILSMKKLLLNYVKLGSRREVSRSRSNVMALCSKADTANSRETAVLLAEVHKSTCTSHDTRISTEAQGLQGNHLYFIHVELAALLALITYV